jgi:hypothetical protein
MQNRLFTISIHKVQQSDFASLSAKLHSHLIVAFPDSPPRFAPVAQAEHTLQLSVPHAYAESVMDRIEEWRTQNRDTDIRIKHEQHDISAPNVAAPKADVEEGPATPGGIPDGHFVEEEAAE